MVDFEIAKTWHRMYVDRLELTIEGIIDEPLSLRQVLDGNATKLGQWLDGPARALDSFEEYAALREAHAHFHECAGGCLSAWRSEAGRDTKAETIAGIRAASGAVLEGIDRLALRFDSDRKAVHYVSQFEDSESTRAGSWSDSLLVGVPTIDEQHRAIIDILDLLLDPGASVRSEAAMNAVTELGSILEAHFSVEEAYMRKGTMPFREVRAHCEEHREILEDYRSLYAALATNPELRIADIANRVRAWAIDHVVTFDIEIRKHLH